MSQTYIKTKVVYGYYRRMCWCAKLTFNDNTVIVTFKVYQVQTNRSNIGTLSQ